MLIAGMADVNSLTDDGRTALMIAVEKGDATSVQMLLKAGADTTLRNKVS
jgi:ankyrin repeat protein